MLCLHSCDIGKGQETFLLAKRPRGCREPRHLRPVSGMEGLVAAGTGVAVGWLPGLWALP